jgi:ADP-L-glycero-D-manno-heptose 6-epimerase
MPKAIILGRPANSIWESGSGLDEGLGAKPEGLWALTAMHDLNHGRIVVTGGAGLIGSAVIWALNRRGLEDILVVDRLDSSEKWRHLVPLRFADCLDADDFATRMAQGRSVGHISTIVHLGACSSTTERDTGYLLENNFEYTKNLAHWAVEHQARFVYASSAATYGALEAELSDESDLHALRPLNAYGYSKHLFDLYASSTRLSEHICGLKYFNVFGPNEDHKGEMRSIVHKAYEQIRESGSVRLFKSYRPEYRDGEQRRDFIYIKDAVAMTLHLAESPAAGLYNVGSGSAHTWLELVRPIFHALELPERIEFVDMPTELRGKYQYYTCARVDRLRATGYDRPATPLADAVTDYVTNYLVPQRTLELTDAPIAAPLKAPS